MDKSFNFLLSKEHPLSRKCIDQQLTRFLQVCEYIKHLPYGRNSNKSDLSLILTEQKGTCSTKHGFIAQIARENDVNDITLCIGIYKMNSKNTPGIGTHLADHDLDYIPEAHTYLRHNKVILDYTNDRGSSFEEHLLYEEEILPAQIAAHKEGLHKAYIKKWRIENSIPYSFKDLWRIRERCIANLSQ